MSNAPALLRASQIRALGAAQRHPKIARQQHRSLGGLRDEPIVIGDDVMRPRETIVANGKVGPHSREQDVWGLAECA